MIHIHVRIHITLQSVVNLTLLVIDDQAGYNYYNLASPTMCVFHLHSVVALLKAFFSLDGTLKAYSNPVGYVSVNTYGREHIYEMQLC